jgi:hypothetical protein
MHHEASALPVGFGGGLCFRPGGMGRVTKLRRHGTACSSHVNIKDLNTVNNTQMQHDVRAANQTCHQRNVLSPNLLSWRVLSPLLRSHQTPNSCILRTPHPSFFLNRADMALSSRSCEQSPPQATARVGRAHYPQPPAVDICGGEYQSWEEGSLLSRHL